MIIIFLCLSSDAADPNNLKQCSSSLYLHTHSDQLESTLLWRFFKLGNSHELCSENLIIALLGSFCFSLASSGLTSK